MNVTERLHKKQKEKYNDFLEGPYGMALPELPDLQTIHTHRWEIYLEQR